MADLKEPKLLATVTPKDITLNSPHLLSTISPKDITLKIPHLLSTIDYPLTVSKEINAYLLAKVTGAMFSKDINLLSVVSKEKEKHHLSDEHTISLVDFKNGYVKDYAPTPLFWRNTSSINIVEDDKYGYVFQGNKSGYLETNLRSEDLSSEPRTIEAWVNVSNYNTNSGIITIGSDTSTNTIQEIFTRYDDKGMSFSNWGNRYTHKDTPVNQWVHVCLVHSEGKRYCFVDGELKHTINVTANPNSTVYIGCTSESNYETSSYVKIAGVRISNVARWTDNFIPPELVDESNKHIFVTSFDTHRNISKSIEEGFDTYRYVRDNFFVNDSYDTNRRVMSTITMCLDTRRRLMLPNRHKETTEHETLRHLYRTISESFDTYRCDSALDVEYYFDTSRDICYDYGVFNCKKIELGIEMTVEVSITIDGVGSAYIKNSSGEYEPFTTKRITTDSIDVQLHVKDKINSATISIIHPLQSKTITAEIDKDGSTIPYGINFSGIPAIFPALSSYDIKIIEQTNTDVTLKLMKNNESVSGTVTFEVRGR